MKRKRNESTIISNKTVCLQNGSNVEVQLDDGKWHAGIVVQCQPRKYFVKVGQQQHWIESDLIRPNTILDQKRNVPFEYRPGQIHRNDTKSTNKIVSDEKLASSPTDPPQTDSSIDLRRGSLPRSAGANAEQKKSPFVWKPSTVSTIQTRRSSRNHHSPGVSPDDHASLENNHCRTRTLSNSTQPKPSSNSVKTSPEVPSSEILIFRPVIRYSASDTNGKQSDNLTSPKRHCSTDDENFMKPDEDPSRRHRHSKDDEYPEPNTNSDLIYHINASTDSRSSSTTSTDNPYLVNQYDTIPPTIDHQIKTEPKPSCFLETPPPSLPDIHVTQESDSSLDKPLQQLKSKRKQDRPQRKQILLKSQDQGQQLNGVLDRLLSNQKDDGDDLAKASPDLCDPGYLSDEYGEPVSSNKDLEIVYQRLEQIPSEQSTNILLNENDKIFFERFQTFIHNHNENYEKLEKCRRDSYSNSTNQRLNLISNILQRIFSLSYQQNLTNFFPNLPDEIKTHMKSCLNRVTEDNSTKTKKMVTRGKRLVNFGQKPYRNIKTKRSSLPNLTNHENLVPNEQQMLLSPSSPLTPVSSKLVEQQSNEELLSPNNHVINSGVMEEIAVLPKERDVYEVIHCLCKCEIDNGFMIQCETCLCWSHCECVGVTATCIPAFFKCSICTKAEAERPTQVSVTSIFDDETTSSFLTTANNADKVSLFLSYSRRLWNLREQMIELKLRYTPKLRSLQHTLRCDDLTELFNCANIQSDEIERKTQARQKDRQELECIYQTIDQIVDSACSSTTASSSCLFIELKTKSEPKLKPLSDQMDILITHLCDDHQTRQARLTIQSRYEQLMSTVDNKIQTILREHQSIQTQMAFELGIFPQNFSDDYLSYDSYELALRAAIERLKC
ncbi:unnamed protein product [Adineta ricciae]|uniref:Uncharacterized protein n=2 Tax=Adineta ricciae TaxID=249248 RepID=A0A814AZM1_ADIRI|nr:unnamed protein product [Adineta ricciae]CAF0918993.1 unnamed protein product [Adineta ricciae]